ncbi:50S ribosomal protein L25/general stress protein Ctc [Corynebacterium halotolerans]|uniref:Large ribosomal subunit protein bL25 n=1 Tax=Corynebacterium halotolerans YIM 70093 = DSM 44683 TaxID=1121362 RepID=M1NR13_9CORY|nr:50S ribosomal protein L25/general stress protein Ctc [Corynebacterium halotolerans]AGF71957.1 50S ribosomal protein L25/general stress protein Ctc [Corynebacterium halotolerans YIM 70093 = DSM 44683]
MATYPTLPATLRTEFGKGSARRLRRDWKIPGVIYGAGHDNIHFAIDMLELTAIVRNQGINAVVELEIDGEKHLTMIKHVDQNVLTFDIDHIDLLTIKRGERVEVEVPVVAEGTPFADGLLIQEVDTILVEADVLEIPEEITVDIEGKEAGTQITAGDIKLPEGITLADDAELLVLNITVPETVPEPEAEGEEGDAAAEGETPAEQ